MEKQETNNRSKPISYTAWLTTTLDPTPEAAWRYQGRVIDGLKRDFDKAVYTASEELVKSVQKQNHMIEELLKKNDILKGENAQLLKEIEEAKDEQ